MKRKIFVAISSLVLAPVVALGFVLPATATPASTIGVVSVSAAYVQAAAPSCVKVTKVGKSWGWPYAKIKNNCRSTQRVKVMWAFAPDSECKTLKPGATGSDSTGMAGRFDGLKKC